MVTNKLTETALRVIPLSGYFKTNMAVNIPAYREIRKYLDEQQVQLVAVSKTKPVEDILALYDLGQRDFGENYVQELAGKAESLPKDIRWHFIGHLQTNKVKLISPFVQLIQGVDSLKLLKEIDKQASRHSRVIDCLLQVHIAEEETKFGFNDEELASVFDGTEMAALKNIRVAGLMGMASFTDDEGKVKEEFRHLKKLFDHHASSGHANVKLTTLSMGMSSDYKIAIAAGSNLVRIGSLLFGERTKT